MNVYIDLDDQYNLQLISKSLESHIGLPTAPMHVYVQNNAMLKGDNLQFGFGNRTSPIFRLEHPFDHDTYSKVPVKELQEMLQGLQNQKFPESEIIRQQFQYFGNNVINVGKMMDRSEWLSESWSPQLRKYAVDDLQSTLKGIGCDSDIHHWLDKKIEQRTASFAHQENMELVGGEKVGGNFRFEYDKAGTGYSLPGYELKLFVNTPIEQVTINGVDTKQLDRQMRDMDWHFGIAETPAGVLKGYKEAEDIEAALTRLSKDDKGAQIAMQLWNNHVPPHVLSKPAFIVKAEAQTDIYPHATFSAATSLNDACESLKASYTEKQGLLADVPTKLAPQKEMSEYADLKGAAVEKLEQSMKKADWTYDYSDDSREWQNGYNEISGIKKELGKLCQVPGGGTIANELWSKYVPKYTVSKPEFIDKAMSISSSLSGASQNGKLSQEKLKADSPSQKENGQKDINPNAEQSSKNRNQRNRRRLE